MGLPEIGRQGQRAAVEQIQVVGDLVVEVVLGRQAQRTGLDAHVDVLGHQHRLPLGKDLAQRGRHRQNAVVGLAGGQGFGQGRFQHAGLQEEPSGGVGMAQPVQRDALLDAALDAGQQLVQAAADLAGVARDLAHAALVVVQLFQRDHRQEHVVLLEAEEGGGIVHQHVGIQHEQLVGRRLSARGAVPACVTNRSGRRQRGVWPCRAGCRIGRAARRRCAEQRGRLGAALSRAFGSCPGACCRLCGTRGRCRGAADWRRGLGATASLARSTFLAGIPALGCRGNRGGHGFGHGGGNRVEGEFQGRVGLGLGGRALFAAAGRQLGLVARQP